MARILIAATISDVVEMKRVLRNRHEFVGAHSMSEALAAIMESNFDLILIGVHFDESRMFDLLRKLNNGTAVQNTPVICFCTNDTALTRAAHESIDVATKALGAWMYLDRKKIGDATGRDEGLRRIIERCLTDEVRKDIQAERMDIHKQRENILRLRQALERVEWSVSLEDRVADLREKLAEVLLELSELQIASAANKEILVESQRLDLVSVPVHANEKFLEQEEARIGLLESEQLGREQEIVPAEEAKAKIGRSEGSKIELANDPQPII